MTQRKPFETLARYPLLDAMRDRRSRRFGVGMHMDSGPMAYRSPESGLPLTEDEEAILAFAACGITGYALGDLIYEPGKGGTIMAGMAGRTVASGDAIQTVSVMVTNDNLAYCEYVHRRYRRFPAYAPPLRTILGFQAGHVDLSFYDRFYRPEVLSETQRQHQELWHS